MEYLAENGRKYVLRYQELREDYHRFRSMTDEEFVDNALDILHFCCIVGYLKELPTSAVLCDDGVIHELVHLVVLDKVGRDDALFALIEIRAKFNSIMELA